MAAILSCRAMLNHRPLRRGCLIEFLYLKGTETPIRLMTCIFRVTCDVTPCREGERWGSLSTWPREFGASGSLRVWC